MRYYFFTLFCSVALIAFPGAVLAATVTFDPQEKDVGTSSPFLVALTIDATQPINVISLSVSFSPGLEPVDVSDGNSIISFWIDKPVYDKQSRMLTFSGLVPGGYSGVKGRLLVLSVQASEVGVGTIAVNEASHVYLNSPMPVEDTLNSSPLSVHIDSAKNNISNTPADTAPPESFSPTIAQIPTADGSQRWMLIFATQDKGSGIDHYEVRETGSFVHWWSSGWYVAESPYVLIDQDLGSRVDIRAYDKSGNVRDESLEATHQSISATRVFLIVITLAGILGVVFGLRLFKRRI